MLSFEILTGAEPAQSDEEKYAKAAKNCLAIEGMDSAQLAKCAAKAGAGIACASAAASSGVGAPVASGAATLCAMAMGTFIEWAEGMWDWINPPSCADRGGTLWCTSECLDNGHGLCPTPKERTLKKVAERMLDREKKHRICFGLISPAGCCTSTYCQLPGMPPPTVKALEHLLKRPSIQIVKGAQRVTTSATAIGPKSRPYPKGTLAAELPPNQFGARQWLVAIPVSVAVPVSGLADAGDYFGLAGAGDYLVITTLMDPTELNAELVPKWRLEYHAGRRSWYETPPVWIGLLTAVAVVGGIFWYRRKK